MYHQFFNLLKAFFSRLLSFFSVILKIKKNKKNNRFYGSLVKPESEKNACEDWTTLNQLFLFCDKIPVGNSACLATSAQAFFFLFLSLKSLIVLLYRTGKCCTASATFSSMELDTMFSCETWKGLGPALWLVYSSTSASNSDNLVFT